MKGSIGKSTFRGLATKFTYRLIQNGIAFPCFFCRSNRGGWVEVSDTESIAHQQALSPRCDYQQMILYTLYVGAHTLIRSQKEEWHLGMIFLMH